MRKGIYSIFIFFALNSHALAAETTLTPRLTLSGEYTDNLFRTPNNEEEDYISSVSPGASFGIRGATAALSITYDPAYVQHKEHSYRDQWRHYGSLAGDWLITRRTKFDLSHALTISEDPADDEGTSTVTSVVNRYMRNTGSASVTNQFGRSDSIALGYNYSLLQNEEDFVEASQRLNPYMDFRWWFIDNRYGMTFYSDYTKGDFEGGAIPSDDFDSYSGNLRLLKRFTRNYDMFIQYAYMQTEYEGTTDNYKVHNPALGFDYIAGEATNISLAFGYAVRDREFSEDDEGPIITGNMDTAWMLSRGSISLNAYSGYTQDTFSTENLGFYVYSGGEVKAEYRFIRTFSGDIFGNYRYSKYLDTEPNIEDHVPTAGAGLSYQALLWLRFRLEYAHRNSISNVESREYRENRVILSATFEPSTPLKLY